LRTSTEEDFNFKQPWRNRREEDKLKSRLMTNTVLTECTRGRRNLGKPTKTDSKMETLLGCNSSLGIIIQYDGSFQGAINSELLQNRREKNCYWFPIYPGSAIKIISLLRILW
jgi:hypothetical protein